MSSYNHWSFCSKHNCAHHAQTHSVISSSRASPLVLCKQVDKRGRVRRKRSRIFDFILCFFSKCVKTNLLHRHTFVTRSVFRMFGTWAEISMNHIPDIKIKIIYHWTEQVTHTYLKQVTSPNKRHKAILISDRTAKSLHSWLSCLESENQSKWQWRLLVNY